jgi:glutathione S-transferase
MAVVTRWCAGNGKHSLEEVTAKLKADFDTCEALLHKSGAYLAGPTPTAANCMLWAFLDLVRSGSS